MQKLFVDFLADKRIVTTKNLASALLKQRASSPAPLELLLEHDKLTPEEVIEVFKMQSTEGLTTVKCLEKLGKPAKELELFLEQKITEATKPIGKVLIDSGHLDAKTLLESIDDFVIENTISPGDSASSDAAPANNARESDSPATTSEVPSDENLSDWEICLHNLNFSKKADKILVSSYSKLVHKLGEDSNTESFQAEFKERIEEASFAAKFIDAEISNLIFQKITPALEKSYDTGLVSRSLQAIKGLLASIEECGQEENYWKDKKNQEGIRELLKGL